MPLFLNLKLLNLSNVYALNVLLFMFKYHRGLLPSVFGNMFNTNASVHEHFTRQSNLFHSNSWRLEIVRRSVRVQGVRYWNLMFGKIDIDCSPVTYKFHLKRFLLVNTLEI